MHCLVRQHCFILPTPPNFGMSLQCTHSEQSSRQQGSHCLQLRERERRLEIDRANRIILPNTLVPIFGRGRFVDTGLVVLWSRCGVRRRCCAVLVVTVRVMVTSGVVGLLLLLLGCVVVG